jgi:acetyl esterase/lipase
MKTIQKISIILFSCLCFYKGYAQQSDTAILYKHAAPASFKSVLVKAVFRLMGKNSLKEEVRSKKFDTSYAASIPKKYFDEILIDTQIVAGRKVYTLRPKKEPSVTKVLYIHGGTFLHNISKPHWNLIIALMRKTHATFIVPDYPLAPFQTAIDAFRMIEEVYKHLLSITDADNIILMGDSAGGGLALSFVQKLKKEGLPQPQQLIMISPWLDITNPDVDKELLKKDPMLEPDGARVAGKMWAGKLDTKNYLVSPIYGDFNGLCPISIFIGGHDILLGDARKLQSLLKQKHIPLNYFEYPKMFHVWVAATFIKEAKVAMGQISELILKKPDQD